MNPCLREQGSNGSQHDRNHYYPDAPPEGIDSLVTQHHQFLVALLRFEPAVPLDSLFRMLQQTFCDLFTGKLNGYLVPMIGPSEYPGMDPDFAVDGVYSRNIPV